MEMSTSESELSTDGLADLLSEIAEAAAAKSQQSLESSRASNGQPKSVLKSVHSHSDVDRDKAPAPRAQRKTVSIDSNGKTGQCERNWNTRVAAALTQNIPLHTTLTVVQF